MNYMGVPKNNSTPKSYIFNRVFHYKPHILGPTAIFGNTHMFPTKYENPPKISKIGQVAKCHCLSEEMMKQFSGWWFQPI